MKTICSGGVGKMYRDFSENSKQKLLGLVSEVENEKLCDFTDWIEDRWYDFEDWIGILNIKNYLNNVNAYHKKVIDKNNTTKETINRIFDEVNVVDGTYQLMFCDLRHSLVQILNYVDLLNEITSPGIGKFGTNVGGFWGKDDITASLGAINGLMDYIIKWLLHNITSQGNLPENASAGEGIKIDETVLKNLSNITKAAGKYGKNDQLTLSSSILGYLGTLYGVVNSDDKTGLGAISSLLSLFRSSVGVETGIYKYCGKTLHPYEFAKLDGKFGNAMMGLSVASGFTDTLGKGIETYNIFADPNSTVYDKVAQTIEMGGSVIGLGGNVYMASQASTKTLQVISGTGSSKVVNQILATNGVGLQYTTSSAVTKNISNVNTGVAVANVCISTTAGAVKRYGEVTSDGEFDLRDAASVGVYGSVSGLGAVASGLTFGLVNIDGEKVAADLESDVSDFVKGDSWAAEYIRNKDNNAICRFSVSVGSAAYIIGENVVEGVGEGLNVARNFVSALTFGLV